MPPENRPRILPLGPLIPAWRTRRGCLGSLEAWQEGGRMVLPPVFYERRVPTHAGRMQHDTSDAPWV